MTDTVAERAMSIETLPEGWAPTTLGEICAKVEKVNPKDDPDRDFQYLDIAAIDNATQKIVQPKNYTGADAPSRARQLVQAGDVLFSTVRTYLRNIAQVSQQHDGQIASTGFTVVRPMPGIEAGFLFHLVQTNDFLDPLNAKQRGTSYPAVRDSDVFAQPVDLPPLNEQRRIVEKIEELFTKLDAGVRSLQQARAQLKSYRRSVLKAAVEGELSREWREAHRDELEPASELLDRILQERREKFAGKKYKEPASPDTSDLPALPDGWEWTTVNQLASAEPNSMTDGPFGSNLKTAHYTASGPRVIRLQNIAPHTFIDEEAHISEEHYERIKKHAVYSGDLVIRALGEPAPVACAIPSWLGKAIVKADCIRFKTAEDDVSSTYVMYALNSYPVQRRTTAIIHGIGRPRLNLTEIKNINIPLPPVEEQSFIVEEVERRLSVVDKLEATVEENLKQAAHLRQSILKQAYAGELVPQDPDDEPASVLLERIREEREAAKQKAKRLRKVREDDEAQGRLI